MAIPTAWSVPASGQGNADGVFISRASLTPGSLLGNRYEIVEILGEGGMGAVYKARDRELDRMVAIKVIRPELAGQPEILQRFKQELILSRKVTHRNVIRIFDLGEAEGVKFITMEYVEGRDLHSLLCDGPPFTLEEKVKIVYQICRALEAAHAEGVVHRDLKLHNVMVEAKGRVVVMDFGIAHSMERVGFTMTGALVGTPAYMSPEQAKGEKIDTRSDLFSLGIIFYELLTGKAPYEAETAMGLLLKRIQERPVPPAERDKEIPQALSDLVLKCLVVDREQRYQTAQQILQDLEGWLGSPNTFRTVTDTQVTGYGPRKTPKGQTVATSRVMMLMADSSAWKWITLSMAAMALVITGVFVTMRVLSKPKAANATVSVLVADFTNHTGDPIFDDTLEPMFSVALEGASFINAFSRGEGRKLAKQLPHPSEMLDEQSARLVAVSQGLGAVITGSLSRRGDGYKLSVEALDGVSGNTIASADVTAPNKDELLLALPKLAAPIRKALGDSTPESVQLTAATGPFTAASLEAVHEYGIAMKQQFAGDREAALQSFSRTAELDPNFARAYAGMAAMAGNLGQFQDAEKYAKLAMEHVDHLTERERYRIRGMYYIRTENWQKCVEVYSELLKQYPADSSGQTNLAACFTALHDMPRAMEEARRAVQIAPKGLTARINFSLDACYAGDFQTCEREGLEARRLNPSSEEGFLVLAYAQLGQGQLPQAAETYQEVQKLGARGASLAASGLANLALYEGRYRQAVQILESGVAADLAAKQPDRAADNLAMLAYAQLLRGEKRSALVAAEKALANSQSAKIRFLVARAFLEAGETAKGRELGAALGAELKAIPRAYAKLIDGEAALQAKDAHKAILALLDAKGLVDTWIGHFDLGRAYLETGLFTEADSEFDRCIKRRGEALELFMDDMPTYSYLPAVYYYQGRVREGLKSPGSADFYQTYVSIRGKAGEDPLLPEVRHRLGQ